MHRLVGWLAPLVAVGCLFKPEPPRSTTLDGSTTDAAPDGALPDPCDPGAIAPPTIHFIGVVNGTSGPIDSVGISTHPGTATSISDLQGHFAFDVATHGPLTASFTFHPPAMWPVHQAYYQRPFIRTGDNDVSIGLQSNLEIFGLYYNAGVTQDMTKATVFVTLRTCSAAPVAGATVTADDGARVIYSGGGSTTDLNGVAYVLDEQVGTATIHAGTATYRVPIEANQVVLANLIQP